MINAIRYIAIVLSFIVNSPAVACKLGNLEQFIEFDKGDLTIGATRAKDIALWFIDWRDIDGISSVLVMTYCNEEVNASQDISSIRLSNVSRLLAPLVAQNVKIEYVNWPRKPHSKAADNYYFNILGISIQPKCIETQSCCGGNMR